MYRQQRNKLVYGLGLFLAASVCLGQSRFSTLDPAISASSWVEPQRRWVLSPAYYAQAVTGHLAVLAQAKPIDDWLADGQTSDVLRQRLQKAQRMRRFATQVLALPDNKSYTRYADLQRRAVVWNVVATPPFSLKLHQWCYPFAGCVDYRGFYQEQAAESFAASLPTNWDVKLYPVAAYSTLGWTQWLGGDPLLNTMLAFPELELAELLFHELAHQRVYVAGDTAFNESYATAVERLGAAAWRAQRKADPDFDWVWTQHQVWQRQRDDFRALAKRTREELERLYSQVPLGAMADMQRDKNSILQAFERRYAQLKEAWGGMSRFDVWALSPNNASFAIQHTYTQWVPAFEQLHANVGGDWVAFHAAVEALGRLPAPQREAQLQVLQGSASR